MSGGKNATAGICSSPELSVILERMPAGTSEVRHLHTKARQFFFVLSGITTLEVAGERPVLRSFEGAEVRAKISAQMLNESEHEAEFIVVSQPPSHGDRILGESIETANT